MEKISEALENLKLTSQPKLTFKKYSVASKLSLDSEIWYFPSNENLNEFGSVDTIFSDTKILKNFKCDENFKINLTSLDSLRTTYVLETLLCFLGKINENNKEKILEIRSNERKDKCNKQMSLIEENNSYLSYIESNLDFIVSHLTIRDLGDLEDCLSTLGFSFNPKIFKKIKDCILSHNKLQIIVCPGNIFWFKETKSFIRGTSGSKSYDKKLNNYTYLYYNWDFIYKFYHRIYKHPRCKVGLLSSMIQTNLTNAFGALSIDGDTKDFVDVILYDQETHEKIVDANSTKPEFKRCFDKMTPKMRHFGLNNTNTVILESEPSKADETAENSINLCIFDTGVYDLNETEQAELSITTNKLLEYLEKMLNTCDVDVREYIHQNPFKATNLKISES